MDYNKAQLINKGNIRRIVIEFEEMSEPLVVLDGVEADTFVKDWFEGLPPHERTQLERAKELNP